MNLKTLNFDVVVIGCGPAGITASIYLKRANLNVCVVEKTAPGGQLNMISEIGNYPGCKEIDGPTLAFNMFEQIRELNVTYKYGNVLEIINYDDYKVVKTDQEEITCKGIIIATGRRPRELGLPNEKRLLGKGISYCSICDGSLYKNKIACVVGGGNSALEGALYLSDICSKVTLIHRKDTFRGEPYLVERVEKKDNIDIIKNANIIEIKSTNDRVSSLVLDIQKEVTTDALFIYIGNTPVPIKCENLNTENDYVIVDSNMKTNIDKIYACGDAVKKTVYQMSTAIGDGATAAMNLIRDL
ncbi:MAG TPA: FAD-dependent oxidoreductase [Bacilli bacterium]|nr:FAD-dependent oxidoreductase [Bacilli bacterium]